MRGFMAAIVLLALLLSSVLVQSKGRSAKEVMSFADVFADYSAFVKLGVNKEKAWPVISTFFSDTELWSACSANPRKALHLVEIYLRSHGLAPCGHSQIHETVGTACSFSRGTELHNFYVRVLLEMHHKKAIDGRCLLYLLEREPDGWGSDEAWFFYDGRIISAELIITDKEVDEQRRKFVAEGFQTAVNWTNDEIRRALVRHQQGKSLEVIDKEILCPRGEAARNFVNLIVRPLYLLLNENADTYEGRLTGLSVFVAANIGKEVPKPEPVSEVVCTPVPAPKPEPVSKPAPPAAAVVPVALPKTDVREAKGFARAYGGSRFGMQWGR